MNTLVVGATGATGTQLVEQLIRMNHNVKVIVRSHSKIPGTWSRNDKISIIKAEISKVSNAEMADYIKDCQAVACCLGHNLTLKGMYGKPRKLVANTVRLLCNAIQANSHEKPVKLVLMNTTANRNRDLKESVTFGQAVVIGLTRLLLPPHRDNEEAADFLRVNIGQNNTMIEWVVVRPDTLITHENISGYEVHPSPIRNPVFNPGKTSRINVGHFMANLMVESELWNTWKGKMPVIYNYNEIFFKN